MSEVNHSPTPWRGLSFYGGVCVKDAKGYVVLPAGYPTIKDVGHIVKCVNSHDALTAEVARLKAENAKMRKVLDNASDTMRLVIESAEDVMQPHLVQEICHCGLAIEKALAAEGGAK